MTPRTRKKPLLVMPPLTCQVPACAAEYPVIGDYADTDRAALLGGWAYRAGGWLCQGHRDHIPWWPGRRLTLPVREPGATRAEVIGVVPRDVSWSTAALPAPEPDLEPLPPARPASMLQPVTFNDESGDARTAHLMPVDEVEDDLEPQPGGTIYPELTPQALAGSVPLATLAADAEEGG